MGPAPESTPPRGNGRIPFTFRIGVTGHCELDQADDLRKPVREAILRLLTLVPIAPGAELALVVVSPLAEGADRLVAEEVLADIDARLEVVLPMDAEDFIRDGSVRRAHRRLGWRDVRAAAEKLRKYNSAEIKKSVFDERARELRTELMPDIAKEIPVDPLGLSGTRSPTGYFPISSAPTSWSCAISAGSAGSAWPSSRWPPWRGGRGRADEFLAPARLARAARNSMPESRRSAPCAPTEPLLDRGPGCLSTTWSSSRDRCAPPEG
jgi:hypothetical protein